jgi:hypothetical protein
MIRRCAAWVIGAALMVSAAGVRAEEGDDVAAINAKIAQSRFDDLPSGPYSGWTDDQKRTAAPRVAASCAVTCGDVYSGLRRPESEEDRTLVESRLCGWQCIAGHLPPDHPLMAELRVFMRKDYEEAKRLGSPLPSPLPN